MKGAYTVYQTLYQMADLHYLIWSLEESQKEGNQGEKHSAFLWPSL